MPLAVAAVLWGWGAAPYPYLLAGRLTIADAAAARPTLRAMLLVLIVGGLLLVPSLAFLFTVFQRPARASGQRNLTSPEASGVRTMGL